LKKAKDSRGKIISIHKSVEGQDYFCVVCGERMTRNYGAQRQYFSHSKGSDDTCEKKLKKQITLKKTSSIATKKNKHVFEMLKLKQMSDVQLPSFSMTWLDRRVDEFMLEMASILSAEQYAILENYNECIKNNFNGVSHQVFTGFAGTGKSFLLGKLIALSKIYGKRYRVAAFTGKAVSNLIKNRIDELDVSTIHRLMYIPVVNDKGDIISWDKVSKINADILFIDEVSMVSHQMVEDILSYKVPTFFIGDFEQLPPIEDAYNASRSSVTPLKDNIKLSIKKIQRQAEGNPIIMASKQIRENIPLCDIQTERNEIGSFVKLHRVRNKETIGNLLTSVDQVICGTNRMRVALNNAIREKLNKTKPIEVGEKLIIIKNEKDIGVFNGMTMTVLRIIKMHQIYGVHCAHVETDIGAFNIPIRGNSVEETNSNLLNNEKFNMTLDMPQAFAMKSVRTQHKIVFAFFGYCITVHKSQGSTIENILVFESDISWMRKIEDGSMYRKGLYTAVTRAERNCYVVF
jgi:ATP-dependent exoDNAse (exonuclease V) alpha subunit